MTPSPGHCFRCLCKDLETHRLPCTSRCPRPCRGVGSAGVGSTGGTSQGCDGVCLSQGVSCKLSAGTSSWPSSKSAVSPGSGVRGGLAVGPHGQRALPGLTCVPEALPSHCPAAPGEGPRPQ